MKNRKRRNRVVAGVALFAASAAVASVAMLGPSVGSVVATPLHHGAPVAALSAHLPGARIAPHAPLGRNALASGKRTANAATAASAPAVAIAAQGVGFAETSIATSASASRAWWLEYAGACSRTRGQPGTDERA
jgi:hypothetical protein